MRVRYLLLVAGLTACDSNLEVDDVTGEVDYGAVQLDLGVDDDEVAADGESTTTVLLLVGGSDDAGTSYATLVTTSGRFEGATGDGRSLRVEVAEETTVTRRLIAPTSPQQAWVTAYYGTRSAEVSVSFVAAYPTDLRITTSGFALVAGPEHSVELTAVLTRDEGTIGGFAPVTWAAADSLGAPIGEFITTTVQSDSVSALFSVGPRDYVGPVTIAASIDAADATVFDQITIWVTEE